MRPVDYSLLTEKRCSSCKVVKPVDQFGKYNDPKHKINGWRYYSRCLDCARAAARVYGTSDRTRRNARLSKWRRDNPDAAQGNDRRKRLKALYDLTPEQVEEMFAAQGHRCKICERAKVLVVDHNHETGEVRGGLCNRCNVTLGWIECKPLDVENLRKVGRGLAAAIATYLGWEIELEEGA